MAAMRNPVMSIPINLILERELAMSKKTITFYCCSQEYQLGKAGADLALAT